MDLKQLMGLVIDSLYDGLTGGSAELPLPQNIMLNWLSPGLPFHESSFDFAIAGPYAGPSPLTLPYFKEIIETLMTTGGTDGTPMDRQAAIDQAKVMYQQHLMGSWEQWSLLVDFIPLSNPTPAQSAWTATVKQESKYQHVSVVYGQAGQTLSQVYSDTLKRCEVADEELTQEQMALIERMRKILTEDVEVEDLLTGDKKIEKRESRAMIAYKEKKTAYENAVIDYAQRLARANNGTAADVVEWQRSGGIYRRRATEGLRDWIANGYKNDIERAQATLNHILGSSMVLWKDNLVQVVDDIQENTSGAFGYSFFPASLLPGGFARSESWSRFSERELHRRVSTSSTSSRAAASGRFSLGFFSIGGSGGSNRQEHNFSFTQQQFGMEFDYTTVEIMRPAFNPNFFLSRGWRPKDSFIRDYGALHSDGKPDNPKGALIGYPTKALFIRDLVIYSKDVADFMRSQSQTFSGGGFVGIGPFCVGGSYRKSSTQSESNLDIEAASIRVKGLQLVGFMSALFPYTANPSPDVKKWI